MENAEENFEKRPGVFFFKTRAGARAPPRHSARAPGESGGEGRGACAQARAAREGRREAVLPGARVRASGKDLWLPAARSGGAGGAAGAPARQASPLPCGWVVGGEPRIEEDGQPVGAGVRVGRR